MTFISIPSRAADLTGKRFARLTVLGAVPVPSSGLATTSKFAWLCRCDCGQEKITSASKLQSNGAKSCGCLKKEADWNHKGMLRHGKYMSKEYSCWKNMLIRCKSHKDYAARGISVCERWKIFENFYADMGPVPSPKLTIERKNNNLGYYPENCCWATRKVQQRNRRCSLIVTAFGKTASLSCFFESSNSVEYDRAHYRITEAGWNAEKAITVPAYEKY